MNRLERIHLTQAPTFLACGFCGAGVRGVPQALKIRRQGRRGDVGVRRMPSDAPKNLSEFPFPFFLFALLGTFFSSLAAQPVFSAGSHSSVATPSKVVVAQIRSIRSIPEKMRCPAPAVQSLFKRQDRRISESTVKEEEALLIGGSGSCMWGSAKFLHVEHTVHRSCPRRWSLHRLALFA